MNTGNGSDRGDAAGFRARRGATHRHVDDLRVDRAGRSGGRHPLAAEIRRLDDDPRAEQRHHHSRCWKAAPSPPGRRSRRHGPPGHLQSQGAAGCPRRGGWMEDTPIALDAGPHHGADQGPHDHHQPAPRPDPDHLPRFGSAARLQVTQRFAELFIEESLADQGTRKPRCLRVHRQPGPGLPAKADQRRGSLLKIPLEPTPTRSRAARPTPMRASAPCAPRSNRRA